MFNKIILILLAALMVISLLTVLPEKLIRRNSGAGRFLRAIRIRLREKSRTSFCVTSFIMILAGLISHDKSFRYIWLAVGIMLVTLIILHPEDILSLFRTRKKARKKKAVPQLARTPVLKGRAKELTVLAELTPVIVDENPAE